MKNILTVSVAKLVWLWSIFCSFLTLLSREGEMCANTDSVGASECSIPCLPKRLVGDRSLKAAATVFAAGVIIATAGDGSGSGSGAPSGKQCSIVYSIGPDAETKDYTCEEDEYCCMTVESRGNFRYVVGYCCDDKDCAGAETGSCGHSKVEVPLVPVVVDDEDDE